MLQRKNQIGRTMVEMLAVIAIIGVLTVGAIAGLSQATEKFRINKTHDDILSINQAIADLFAWQRRYPDNISSDEKMSLMCKNDIFPDGCINNSVAKNPYGGKYTVSTDSVGSILVINLDNLPDATCAALLDEELDWGDFLVVDPSEPNPTCKDGTFTIKLY